MVPNFRINLLHNLVLSLFVYVLLLFLTRLRQKLLRDYFRVYNFAVLL